MRKSHDLGLPPFGFCSSRAAPRCPSGQSGAAWQRREMAGAGGMWHVPPPAPAPPRSQPSSSAARDGTKMPGMFRVARDAEGRAACTAPGRRHYEGPIPHRAVPRLSTGGSRCVPAQQMRVTRSGPRRRIVRPRLVPARPRAARPASRRPRRPAAALSPNAREGTAPRAGGGASERSPSPFLTHALVLPRDKALV